VVSGGGPESAISNALRPLFEYLGVPQPIRTAPQFSTCKNVIVVLDSLMFHSNFAILHHSRPVSLARSRRVRADLSSPPGKIACSARGNNIRARFGVRLSWERQSPDWCSERKSPARGAFAVSKFSQRSHKSPQWDITPAISALTKNAPLTPLESALTKIDSCKPSRISTYKKKGEGVADYCYPSASCVPSMRWVG
jgi:hypothetical protein